MTTKFKGGDKVWLKAVVADLPSCDGEIWLNVAGRSMWTTAANIRPRVKRKQDSYAPDEDMLLRAVQRVLIAIATAAGMYAASRQGAQYGKWLALNQVRDDLGTVRYVASRIVHEVIGALQWDVTEAMRKSTVTVPEMRAVRGLQGALRKLDRDWMGDRLDANLSLADVLEAKP